MRREIIGLLLAAALTACFEASLAQPPEPVRTVGVLYASHPSSADRPDRLREALRERGWIEGRNLRVEIHYAVSYTHLTLPTNREV